MNFTEVSNAMKKGSKAKLPGEQEERKWDENVY